MCDERHSGVATGNLLFVFVIVFYGNSFLWLGLVSVASSRTTPPRALLCDVFKAALVSHLAKKLSN